MHAKLPAKCCDVRTIHRLMMTIWKVYKQCLCSPQLKELVKFEHLQYIISKYVHMRIKMHFADFTFPVTN